MDQEEPGLTCLTRMEVEAFQGRGQTFPLPCMPANPSCRRRRTPVPMLWMTCPTGRQAGRPLPSAHLLLLSLIPLPACLLKRTLSTATHCSLPGGASQGEGSLIPGENSGHLNILLYLLKSMRREGIHTHNSTGDWAFLPAETVACPLRWRQDRTGGQGTDFVACMCLPSPRHTEAPHAHWLFLGEAVGGLDMPALHQNRQSL